MSRCLSATVSGAGSQWTQTSLSVGKSGTGTLNVTSGGTVETTSATGALIGEKSGSVGTATITGAGSSWTHSNLYVGAAGTGTLNVQDGAQFVTQDVGSIGDGSGSHGGATVTGYGSKWSQNTLVVGNSGNGTLAVEDGAAVATAADGVVGDKLGSTGVATVTGSGSKVDETDPDFLLISRSKWSQDALYVGNAGNGTLSIGNGGRVSTASFGSIGDQSSGIGNVVVSAADWTTASYLNVGNHGAGTLTIQDGGQVSNTVGLIGAEAGSTGSATVSGTGSSWSQADLYVGSQGNGTLNVDSGGQVDTSGFGFIGLGSGSTGQATVSGTDSSWSTGNGLYVGNTGSGSLLVENGGGVIAGSGGAVGANSGATGTVTVKGADSYFAALGSLYVGDGGTGTLTIQDDARASVTGSAYIGSDAGSSGTVTVAGIDQPHIYTSYELTVGADLIVGSSGNGTLDVTNGAHAITHQKTVIGDQSGSTGDATVTGAYSEWTFDDTLTVGNSGSGTLYVADGAEIVTKFYDDTIIGNNSGSTGVVTVTGTGSAWSPSYLSVGYSGNGTLKVEDGGQVASLLFRRGR